MRIKIWRRILAIGLSTLVFFQSVDWTGVSGLIETYAEEITEESSAEEDTTEEITTPEGTALIYEEGVCDTDLSISAASYLEGDLIVEGDLHIYNRFQLNQYTLTVEGDLYIYGAAELIVDGTMETKQAITLRGGNIQFAGGTFISNSTVCLDNNNTNIEMTSAEDCLDIRGNLCISNRYEGSLNFTKGTLRLTGDYLEIPYYGETFDTTGIVAGEEFLVQLNGTDSQMLDIQSEDTRILNVEMVGEEVRRLYIAKYNPVTNYQMGEHELVTGVYRLTQENYDFDADNYQRQGHYYYENVYVEKDTFENHDGALTIHGNFYQNGTVTIRNGMTVNGNYCVQGLGLQEDTLVAIPSEGILYMASANYSGLTIHGDFIMESIKDQTGAITGSQFSLYGSLYQKGEGVANFVPEGNFYINFYGYDNGSNSQVSFQDAEKNWLPKSFTNGKTVDFLNEIPIGGTCTGTYNGIGLFTSETLNYASYSTITAHVIGDLVLEQNLIIPETSLIIDENLNLNGHMLVCVNLTFPDQSNGQLVMEQEADTLQVLGDFYTGSLQACESVTKGTIYFYGNVTQKNCGTANNLVTGEQTTVIFYGSGRVQEVSFDSSESILHTVVIQNGTGGHTKFLTDVTIVNLRDDSGTLLQPTEGITGYTLTEDTTIEGNLWLLDGTLDLNGFTLHVTGDVYGENGTIAINRGSLIVDGDLRLQSYQEVQGEVAFGAGTAKLSMNYAEDIITVKGDFYEESNKAHTLTAGTMEIAGDVSFLSGNITVGTNCKLVLNGTEEQIVTSEQKTTRIGELNIENTESVQFIGEVLVTNRLLDCGAIKSGTLQVVGLGVLGAEYTGDIQVSGNTTEYRNLQQDTIIHGNLYLDNYSELGTYTLQADTVEVNRTCYMDAGTFICDMLRMNASISMTYEKAQIITNDMYVNLKCNATSLKAGTITIQGSFIEESYVYPFRPTGTHKVILERKENDAEEVRFQLERSRFQTLQLNTNIAEYTCNREPLYLAEEIIGNYGDTEAPTKPQNVAVTSVTYKTATITWEAATDNDVILGYRIYYEDTCIAETTDCSYPCKDLVQGTGYDYKIEAVDISGNVSKQVSITVTTPKDTTPPNAVTSFACEKTFTANSVPLTWKAATDDGLVAYYNLYRDNALLAQVEDTAYTDTTVVEGETYTYTIEAVDWAGNVSEVVSCEVTPLDPPDAVTNLRAESEQGVITVSWNGNDRNVSRYYVSIYEGDKFCDIIHIVSDGSGSYSGVCRLAKGDTTYTCQVQPRSSAGQTGTLEKVTVYNQPDEEAPVITEITGIPMNGVLNDNTRIQVYAMDNCRLKTLTMEYALEGSEEWTTLTISQFLYPSTGEGTANCYFNIQELKGNYELRFTVTDQNGNTTVETVPVAINCIDVNEVTIQDAIADSGNITLTWETLRPEEVSYYRIEEIKDGKVSCLYKTFGNSTSCTVQNLYPNQNYELRVVPYSTTGTRGVPSDTVQVRTLEDTEAPLITNIFTSPSAMYLKQEITCRILAEDETGIQKVVLCISGDGENWEVVSEEVCEDIERDIVMTSTITTTEFEDGEYYIKAEAYDLANNISNTYVIERTFDNTSPVPPSGMEGYLENGTACLTWSGENAEEISYYRIYRKVNDEEWYLYHDRQKSSQYVDSTLAVDNVYTYRVIAVDLAGNESDYSTEIQVSTCEDEEPPSKPENVLCTGRTGSSILLTWDASTDNVGVKEYQIYRDGTLIQTTDERTCYDTDLQTGKFYAYTVEAVDWKGNVSATSEEISVSTVMTRMEAITPENYATLGNDMATITFDWYRYLAEEPYQVIGEYSANGKDWTVIDNQEVTGCQMKNRATIDWNLEQLTEEEYQVRLRVIDPEGNETSVTQMYYLDKTPPASVEVVQVEEQRNVVYLYWDKSISADVDTYAIYRRTNEDENWRLLTEVEENVTNYTDSDVIESVEYQYGVIAIDGYGLCSEQMNSDWIQVSQDTISPEVVSLLPKNEVLSGMVVLRVEAEDNRKVASIQGEYYDATNNQWILFAEADADEGKAELVWDTLSLHGRYKTRILAVDISGNTNEEAFEQYYDIDNQGISKIQKLQGTAVVNSVVLSWDEVTEDDFDYFAIEQWVDGEYQEIGISKEVLGYQVDGLTPETEYEFRVVGYDLYGNRGEESDSIILTTGTDIVAPVIKSIMTRDGQEDYHTQIPLQVAAMDNMGIQSVRLEYSYDGEEWTLLNTFDWEGKPDWSISYDWNVQDLPDGTVSVRAVATDINGNENDENQYVRDYVIDHVAPEQVIGLRWAEENGIPVLEWNPVADSDIKTYRIMITDESGQTIEQERNALFFEHRDGKPNQRYTYQVCAIDMAGNIGMLSETISGIRSNDDVKPQVASLVPYNQKVLSREVTLSAMVIDNIAVREVQFYYQAMDTEEGYLQLIQAVESKDANGVTTCQWDTQACADGKYQVWVQAIDSNANKSEWYTMEYTVDNTAPEQPTLNGTPGNYRCLLNWEEQEWSETVTYELYRRSSREEEFRCVYSGEEKSYVDEDVIPILEYGYKLRVTDEAGNYSESYVTYIKPKNIDDIAPLAYITANSVTVEGYEIVLDGIQSTDNQGIQSFHWDFGDGTEGTGAKAKHIYAEKGTYTVTLTVTDMSGNTATDTATVKVLQKGTTGSVTLTVVDQWGNLIPNATVYAHTGTTENDTFVTDEYAQCRIVAEPGTYKVALFKNGYTAKEIEITVRLFDEAEQVVTLETGDTVSGELTVRKLNFEEIIAAGIDISAPENQHLFIVRTEFVYEERRIIEHFIVNENGTCQGQYGGHVNGSGGMLKITLDPATKPRDDREDEVEIEEEEVIPTVTVLHISKSIRWLMDMYEAKLIVYNNSNSSSLTFEENSATIELPKGIGLAKTATPQYLTQSMETIRGGQSQQAVWYLKGVRAGKYTIKAHYEGTFMPFNTPIQADFESNEFTVNAGSGLVLYIEPEKKAYNGHNYYVYFTLRNEGAQEFYNLQTTFGTAPAKRYYQVDTEGNAALPLMSNGDYISVPCLPPGAEIRGYYVTQFSGTHRAEYKYYWELVNAQVDILHGENLGVEVRLSPRASYISIPDVIYYEIDPSQLVADPVDSWSGAYLEERQLLSMGDDSAFHLTMQYNSKYTSECGEFGCGWVHNYEARLVDMQDGTVRYYRTPNSYYSFMMDNLEEQEPWTIDEEGFYILDASKLQMEQTYTCFAKPELSLERTADGTFILQDDAQTIYTFSQEGDLTSITGVEGRTVTLERTPEQVVITDTVSGRNFTLYLNEKGLVETLGDSAGRSTHFYYDEQNRLTVYENAVGERTYYTYDENNRILTGSYQNGTAYVTNTYDEEGRVITQDDGLDNTPLTFFTYTEDEETGKTTTRVTNRLGDTSIKEYDADGNVLREVNELSHAVTHTYDDMGNEITITDANGNMKVCEYDENQNLIHVTDAYGNTVDMTYDEDNQLIATNNSNGEYVRIAYDEKGLISGTTDQNLNRTQYTYNDVGQVLTETNEKGTITYEYTNGDVTKTTDRMGNVTETRYDSTGRILSVGDEYGILEANTYDALGRIITKTDASGGITTYTYDTLGNIKTMTDPDGGITTFEYNEIGWLIRMTDPEGGVLEYTVNSEGWITSVTDSLGRTKYMEYDKVGNVIAEIDQEGNRTEYTYDGGGNVLTTTNPEGTVTTASYYPNGKLAKETNGNGIETVYTYDVNWRTSNITSDSGASVSYEYTPNGNLRAEIDALGNRTEYTYDTAGNVIMQQDPMGNQTAYEYDANSNLTKQTDALGNTTTYTYDSRNRLTRITQADGSTIRLEYDAGNNIIQTIDPMGNTITYEYDNQNRCTRIIDGNGDTVEETTYDYKGNPITVADALGNLTYTNYDTEGQIIGMTQTQGEEEQSATYTYDKLGRITQTIDSMGNPVGITYDALGNITSITDAGGGTTTYAYDNVGNLIQEVNPLQKENRYTYNARNLLAEAVNATGEKTTYEYDALGRIVKLTDNLGTIHYTYDKNSNVLSVEENGATIRRTYDALNRVTSYTDYAGRTIQYSYDQVGNLITLTYPGGEIVRYEYNPDGTLSAVIDSEGNRTEYGYDKNGQTTSIRRPDGTTEAYTYDKAGRLTGQTDVAKDGTVIQNLGYTYDGYGNITETKGFTIPDPSTWELTNNHMEYNEANQLVRYNDQIVRYDSKGNMIYGPLNGVMTEFTYDCRNRLIQAGDTTYTYDAENNRIASTTDGITTEYVVNTQPELSQVLQEYVDHAVTVTYTYGNGKLISDRVEQETGTKETGNRYYHYDNLGSTRALTSESGEIIATYSYGIYGELLSGDKTQTGYLYNGAYGVHTDNNGLYYMRARYYNADISRFINQDILTGTPSASQSLNRYAYCQGNPINQNDPFGLCPQGMTTRDWIHLGLSIAGCIPYVGILANIANAVLYFREGDVLNGVLSMAGAAVGVGGIMSAVSGVGKVYCAIRTAGVALKTTGIAYTTGTTAVQTIEGAVQTYLLLEANNFELNKEVLMSAGQTVLSGAATLTGFKAIGSCIDEMAYFSARGLACFTADTKVLTSEGYKNIEDIEVGDYVYSTDEETGESDYKEVLQVFVKETEVITHVYYETENEDQTETHEIETTLNHLFYVEGDWKAAGTLEAGDLLTLADGTQVAVSDITYEDRHTVVYNMEVADYHTYYVGEQSVWVHNNGCGSTVNNQNVTEHMVGESGTQTSSKTTWQNGKTERIDVENPNPGVRPGQIHYHDSKNNKWMYDINGNFFYNGKNGNVAPNHIQKVLQNSGVQQGIEKALKLLGEL